MKSHHALSLRAALILGSFAAFALLAGPAWADPLPGEVIKFQQLPLDGGIAPGVLPGYYTGPYFNTNGLPAPAIPSTAPFGGHDELSTAYSTAANPNVWQGGGGTAGAPGGYMADDFADQFTTPVVHVRWWGSYMNGTAPPVGGVGVKQFLITFESDVPAVPPTPTSQGIPSHPGTPLLSQIVTLGALAPSSGTFTETNVSPPAAPSPTDGPLFQYNAELKTPFFENQGTAGGPQPNTVYWLKIVALADPTQANLTWGWHDRDWSIPDSLASVSPAVKPGENVEGVLPSTNQSVWHFQDDAVAGSVLVTLPSGTTSPTVQQTGFTPQNYVEGVDGPTGISQFSKDLAFELFTPVPEPTSVALLGLGGIALGAVALRRRIK
jgi:hypothetical protein